MNEFDENENRPENLPDETPVEAPQETAPQNDAPESEPPKPTETPEPEPTPEPAPEPNKLPEQPAPVSNEWAYSWDGQSYQKRNSGKGARKFFIIAAICLVVSIAICLPTILYALNSDNRRNPSGNSSVAGGDTSDVQGSSEEDISYEVSHYVDPSDVSYTEESAESQVYEKCAPSCCTVYVTEKNGYSLGSGFVLTADGYIATNQHVVDGGIKFKVIFYDGTEYEAKVVGEDSVRDLAVLRIEAKGLTPLEIGNSASLKPGQHVIAIGTPYDMTLEGTMTMGVISGTERKIKITDDSGRVTKTMTLIQTDTSINPGNSGGPLINMKGQVVGINSLKIVEDYFEGIGFAIPINYAADIFNQLIQYGKVVNEPEDDFVHAAAYLGIQVTNADNGLESLRIKPSCEYPEGAFVATVTPGTAVYAAGLQPYDIITEFCGVKITDITSLTDELANHKAGETVSMTFFRFDRRFASGEYLTIKFVLDSAK